LLRSTLASGTTTYASDGEGHRVQKSTSGVTRTYVYNVGGDLVAEYSTSRAPSNLACTVCYVAVDNLGSTRLITAGSTGQVVKRTDFLPFGEIIPAGVDGRTTALGYESAERGRPFSLFPVKAAFFVHRASQWMCGKQRTY